MKHYFTDNTDLKSEQSQFIFRFHKYDLLFTSDNGVFSKNMIDYGSRVLLDNIEITNEKTLLDVGCGYGTFGICLNKVYSHLNVDMVDVNDRASLDQIGGIVGYMLSIKGSQVSVFASERDNGIVKLSFRSKSVDVNKIASEYGGGGHILAAGASVEGNLKDV